MEMEKEGEPVKAFHEVRSYDSDVMAWCSKYENISFLSHWHQEIELIYVRSGACRISVGDQSFFATGGDLVICDSGNIHYSDSYDEENVLHFLVFDPRIISSVYENSRFLQLHITKEQMEIYGLTRRLEDLFDTVEQELAKQDKYYQNVVEARIREFWYLLKRNLPLGSKDGTSYNKRVEQMYDFQKILSYMEEHYNENITLEFAAAKMNFSSSHFSKVFKKMTGINFVTYLNMTRVEKAMDQLKNTSRKITDIGLNCGFSNVRSFNRVFKDITGCTPREFSQQMEDISETYGRRKELEKYNPSYYLQKYSQKKYVENDSMTVIKNK